MNIKYTITKAIDKRISKSKQENIKYYLHIGLTLLVIAAVTATMLAFVNALTRGRIAENERAVMQDAVGRIFEECDGIKAVDKEYDSPVVAVYEVYKGDELLGRGVQVNPTGFKEAINMIVGVDGNGKCVGVEIISLSDTPGVGTKVKEKTFLEGFDGLDSQSVGTAELISGATISSTAVKKGVEAALKLNFNEEEKNDEPSPEENGDGSFEEYPDGTFEENIEEYPEDTLSEETGEFPFGEEQTEQTTVETTNGGAV